MIGTTEKRVDSAYVDEEKRGKWGVSTKLGGGGVVPKVSEERGRSSWPQLSEPEPSHLRRGV